MHYRNIKMSDFIETPRLIIKPPSWNDFEAYYGLLSDPDVMRYIGKGVKTQQESRDNLQQQIEHFKHHGFSLGSVYEKQTGLFVGRAGLVYLEMKADQPQIEIGYALHQRFWNQGYGTELVKACIHWGFMPCESASYPQPSGELAYSIGLFNQLMENNAVCLDPYNPNEITYYKDWENPVEFFAKESILELPQAPAMIALKKNLVEIKQEERVLSAVLEFNDTCLAAHPGYQNTQRKYWVYLPPHYNSFRTYPLMLFLDGGDYLGLFLTPAILDTLIAQGDIPPCLAVFFDYSPDNRMVEYNCHDAFTDFISGEFLHILSIKHGFSIHHSPELTTIAGYSASGLAAFYAGISRSERFGQVIAQSPSLEILQKSQLRHFIRNVSSRQTRFYFETGSLEILPAELIFADGSSQAFNSLQACRDTADELQRQGWRVGLQEFVGGHNSICWRQSLPAKIIAAFSSGNG